MPFEQVSFGSYALTWVNVEHNCLDNMSLERQIPKSSRFINLPRKLSVEFYFLNKNSLIDK